MFTSRYRWGSPPPLVELGSRTGEIVDSEEIPGEEQVIVFFLLAIGRALLRLLLPFLLHHLLMFFQFPRLRGRAVHADQRDARLRVTRRIVEDALLMVVTFPFALELSEATCLV